MSGKNHDYNPNSLSDFSAVQIGQQEQRCEESVKTPSINLDDRQKNCDKTTLALMDQVMNNPESQVQYPEYQSSQENERDIQPLQTKEDNGPQGIEFKKTRDMFQDIMALCPSSSNSEVKQSNGILHDTPSLGKRAPQQDLSEQINLQKAQKFDTSIKIELDSKQHLEFDADSDPLQCVETLKVANVESQVGISNSRTKREKKKNTQFDNSEYIIDNDEPLENARESGVSTRKRHSSSTNAPIKNCGIQQLKFQKIADSQDPFQNMYKYIMEPIIQFDRLEVLHEDKLEYEILVKAKDLKHHNVNKDRKEEMLVQRVHLESQDHGMLVVCDLDPNFERHVDSRVDTSAKQDTEGEQVEDRLVSGELDDLVSPSIEPTDADDFKKPQTKRISGSRKRRSSNFNQKKSQSQKSYSTCLPNSIRDCSWLSNTDYNINLLSEKSNKIKEEREKRKVEEKAAQESEIQRLIDNGDNHFVQVDRAEALSLKQTEGDAEMKEEVQTQKAETELDQVEQALEQELKPKAEEPKEEEPKVPELPKEPVFEYILPQDLKSIDQISIKFKNGYYHSLDKLLSDLQHLVQNTIKLRCKNTLAKIYLSNFLLNAQKIIKEKNKDFLEKWKTYYNIRLSNNQLNNCIVGHGDPKVWYKKFDQSTKREYHEIQDYKIKIPGETEPLNDQDTAKPVLTTKQQRERDRVQQIMKTEKKSKCSGDCCIEQDQIQKPKTGNMHMSDVFKQSKCECIQTKTECGPKCGCDPQKCRNRQMSLNQSLRFGIDVEERVTWGIDICTAVNFMSICPRDLPRQVQSNFVEKKLIYAIQQQNEQGYDVLRALKFIIEANLDDEVLGQKYQQQDKEIASIMYDAIINCPTKNEYHFRVHTKGVGIFCKMKQGIKKDSLVVEYFGEIYRPWHWFEKQDVIKQGQNLHKLPKDLPEFYNILFERHLDDPQGYNILTVDPILHGNYSSRLSHSCVANCQTVNKVRNDQYSIGMFTNKDISFGEELCFDYCSFTESEKEYDEAICLCGTEYCKGKFLNLANDKKNLSIMKNNHTFIDRNYLLYKAVTNPSLTEEDIFRLHSNGLRSSSLNVAPSWLQKWASLICEYLEFEEILYPTFYKDDFPDCYKLDDIKVEARMQKETQIQNIAITIDKIMHVLESMGTELPPIRPLNYEERYKRIWEEPGCLKDNVMSVLEKMENCPQADQAKIILRGNNTLRVSITDGIEGMLFEPPVQMDEEQYKQKYKEARKQLSDISAILRSVNSVAVAVPAFCDILMMYAYTETYFTQTEVYKKCKSDEVIIRKCDVRHGEGASMDKYNQGKQAYKGCKEYDSQYIWGQLVVWYKQTVDKPNASLSADRRGTLSIPDVQSFIVNPSKIVFDTNNTQNGQKGKRGAKGKKNNRESTEEILPSSGSRSRPRTTTSNQVDQPMQIEQENQDIVSPQDIKIPEVSSARTLKIIYPSKRLQKRKEFLGNWREFFSKQWDVCCQWSFQNKKKMYGSIQFESVLQADLKLREQFKAIDMQGLSQEQKQQKYHERYQSFINTRLEYFDDTVSKLLQY